MTHRERRLHKALTVKRNPEREWMEALINAGILAGLTFFSTRAGTSIAGLMAEPLKGLLAAGLAAAVTFFTRLALERGLK